MSHPARKDPQRAQQAITSRTQSLIPSWILEDGGFTALPRGFFREACRRLTPAGRDVLGLVYEETIGSIADQKPKDATDLSTKQIAQLLGYKERIVTEAFSEIAPLIVRNEVKGVGAFTSIRPRLFSNLCSMPERAPRAAAKPKEKPSKAQELAALADDIRQLAKLTIEGAIRIGEKLVQAKAIAGHGNWEGWLKKEFGWSITTAKRYVAVFEHFGEGKSVTVTDLNIDLGALYLLVSPNTKSETVSEIVDRARSGERITKADVREAIEKQNPRTPVLGSEDDPRSTVRGSKAPVIPISAPETTATAGAAVVEEVSGSNAPEASAVVGGQPANFRPADLEAMKQRVAPVFAAHLRKVPDAQLLSRAHEALQGAPVDELYELVDTAKPAKWKKYGAPFLVTLANQVAEAHAFMSSQPVPFSEVETAMMRAHGIEDWREAAKAVIAHPDCPARRRAEIFEVCPELQEAVRV